MSYGPDSPSSAPVRTIPWRDAVAPGEHGAWGVLGAAVIAGLLAAPTIHGVLVALAATIAVVARHGLRLALGSRRSEMRRAGWVVAAVTGALATAAFAHGVMAADRTVALPTASAMVLGGCQLALELQRRRRGGGRGLVETALGAAGLASVAGIIVLVAPRPAETALTVSLMVGAYAIGVPWYVRARLRLQPGAWITAAWIHLALLLIPVSLWLAGAGSLLAVLGFIPVCLRVLLAAPQRRVSPMVLGLQEMAVSFLLAVLVALGLRD